MVIELSGVQFGLKTRDFKIKIVRPKLYDPKIK